MTLGDRSLRHTGMRDPGYEAMMMSLPIFHGNEAMRELLRPFCDGFPETCDRRRKFPTGGWDEVG